MKKIIYILFAVTALLSIALSGCYEDKGNYKYLSLDSLSISLPATSYISTVGNKLKITPAITTAISDDDLSYQWEVQYTPSNYGAYRKYVTYATGKNLNYTIALNDTMPTLSTYKMRLHVIQKSINRDFYSNDFTVTIGSDIRGLVVLHGDDSQSDVGLIRANEFMATSTDAVDSITVTPHFWSSVNSSKISGKGKQIMQNLASYYDWASSGFNNATGTGCADVGIITDKGGAWGSYSALKKEGNWNDGFYGNLNAGTPQSMYIANGDQYIEAVDGGELFLKNYSLAMFIAPFIGKSSGYYFGSPAYKPTYTQLAQAIFFDSKKRAFIGCSYFSPLVPSYTAYTMTTDTSVCNLGDIKADLVYMDCGGVSGHFLAVLQDDSNNKFIAEIDPAGGDNHQQSAMAYAKYDMSTLTDINNAKYYAFGDAEVNMCYYGTSSAVYRFSAIKGNALSASVLKYSNGTNVDFGGATITMVKVLKPATTDDPTFNYFNYNQILLVGTYGGSAGTGKLYSLTVDQLTGLVVSENVYTGFDQISDANIKAI